MQPPLTSGRFAFSLLFKRKMVDLKLITGQRITITPPSPHFHHSGCIKPMDVQRNDIILHMQTQILPYCCYIPIMKLRQEPKYLDTLAFSH
jgi:hypothetical protein